MYRSKKRSFKKILTEVVAAAASRLSIAIMGKIQALFYNKPTIHLPGVSGNTNNSDRAAVKTDVGSGRNRSGQEADFVLERAATGLLDRFTFNHQLEELCKKTMELTLTYSSRPGHYCKSWWYHSHQGEQRRRRP